jgi:hypothetical protein
MGSDAELVVLSMGLALRDIFAAHFVEEDDDSNDCPDWVKSSPLVISDGEDLMYLWKKQLPAEIHTADDSDPKGKGKGKATRLQNKRKGVSPVDNSSSEEEKPE